MLYLPKLFIIVVIFGTLKDILVMIRLKHRKNEFNYLFFKVCYLGLLWHIVTHFGLDFINNTCFIPKIHSILCKLFKLQVNWT